MNPTDPHTPQTNIKNPLTAMADGEVTIFAVRRHIIGLLGMYISFGLLLVIVAVSAITAPSILTEYDSQMVSRVGLSAFLACVLIVGIFGVIAHVVYYGNRWILTSDSLTQISQKSLFSKQNSQLSLGNLEDISAVQDGILAHMFNYGVLKVETAGEHSKFYLTYTPNPNHYAQQILIAREAFERGEQYNKNQQTPPYPGGVNTNLPPQQ